MILTVKGICGGNRTKRNNNNMDANIGAKERVTQNRLIGLFKNVLKYTYLGNWVENPQRVDPVCQTPLTLAAI